MLAKNEIVSISDLHKAFRGGVVRSFEVTIGLGDGVGSDSVVSCVICSDIPLWEGMRERSIGVYSGVVWVSSVVLASVSFRSIVSDYIVSASLYHSQDGTFWSSVEYNRSMLPALVSVD